MTTASSFERWRRLADAGIVSGEPPVDATEPVSWTISALVGAAAWLAALFLLFFLGLALENVVERPAGAILIGVAVIGAAIATLRWGPRGHFIEQLATAFSLAGQALVMAGAAMEGGWRDPLNWIMFALLEGVLVVIVQQAGHRLLATLASALAVLMALRAASMGLLFLPLLLGGFVAAQAGVLASAQPRALWTGVATGLALGLLAALVHAALPDFLREAEAAGWQRSVRPVGWVALVIVCIAAAAVLARDAGVVVRSRAGLAAMFVLAAIAVGAHAVPAVAAAFVIVLMAFAAGQRPLLAIGAVALVAALAHHYYQLDATLLQKSAGLAAIAGVLLAARFTMPWWLGGEGVPSDA